MVIENASFAYHEPDIATLLILSSFLLLLNVINFALDKLIYCGLLGQILVGVWFGTPGVQWLDQDVELAVQQLGYIGLTMLVYEGGLTTDLKALRANLLLSSVVAITGIGAPIGLSFVLQSLMRIDSLQAFAAGAALCSTSLGTTFTVLMTSGLIESRLGVVLTSAAMMDDVVGLVMVQIISSLGNSGGSFIATTVVRPVFVSIAYAVLTPLVCTYFVAPCTTRYIRSATSEKSTTFWTYLTSKPACFVWETLFLIAMVSSATYAGTSGLFAAYLAGAVAAWYDSVLATNRPVDQREQVGAVAQSATSDNYPETATNAHAGNRAAFNTEGVVVDCQSSGRGLSMTIYEEYYSKPVDTILKPFFFASIGCSIPITRMFEGNIVWRGIVYTVLMLSGKLVCGFWLVRIPNLLPRVTKLLKKAHLPQFASYCMSMSRRSKVERQPALSSITTSNGETREGGTPTNPSSATPKPDPTGNYGPSARNPGTSTSKSSRSCKPLSLYPCLLLGGAMVARGEIGFLISAVAQSSGIFTNDLFLVVTWAIFLCTFIGPVTVGLLVRRVKRLQGDREAQSGREDPLGIWGMMSQSNS